MEEAPREGRPSYDPACYMCPGNARAGGARNPGYAGIYVFPNDFPALLPDAPQGALSWQGLLVARSERGLCRVVCFSPRHDLTLPEMPLPEVRRVVDAWTEQYRELAAVPWISHVQIFENKGAMMGASNPHPHSQIWANENIPLDPAKEIAACTDYHQEKGRCLLCDYLALEEREEERLVCANEHFVALVPFWAFWPFETLLLSRRHVSALTDLTPDERTALADILKRLTARYDNLFQTEFPYSMGFHQRPTDGGDYPALHFHAHYYPPLLRSATVRKFMVGYELLANPQRDITAEASAERLRELSEVHYRQRPPEGTSAGRATGRQDNP